MTDTARAEAHATVTIPGVTPDLDSPGSEIPGDEVPGGGDDDGWGAPLDGLKRLATPKRRGDGGRGRRPGRPAQGGGGIDFRNTWQILAGSILIPLGVVFILMAWYGSAHTAYVQQQIPYLVSGSFAGVASIVLGGLLYWAHWLYRIYDQADLHHEEQLRVLEQAIRAMTERAGATMETTPSGGTPAIGAGGTTALAGGYQSPSLGTGRQAAPSYVVTPTGSVYHLPDCPVVAHHPEGLRSIAPAATSSLEPCRICLPGAR
ncbi:MAG TPA: hypothetical protein DCQ30_00375 [Acidimicrobiaceae bacterium]|nr:hypothetical protein [Acidimicrobiaceae bacterium]